MRAVAIVVILLLAAGALWVTRSRQDTPAQATSAPIVSRPNAHAAALDVSRPSMGDVELGSDLSAESVAGVNHSLGSTKIEGAGILNPRVIPGSTPSDAGVATLEEDGEAEPTGGPGAPRLPMPQQDGPGEPSELELSARNEARDESWAPNAEAQIRAAFGDADYGDLREVTCGTTMCALVLKREGETSMAFVRDALSGIPWQAPSWVRPSDSGHTLNVVIAREGHVLGED